MAKKRNLWDMPPEGLWISPTGKSVNMNEHLIAIRDDPDSFGIPYSEVESIKGLPMEDQIDYLRKIADGMISQGWTRYRYLDGTYHFEVDDAQRRHSVIDDILARANAAPQESLIVSQVLSPRTFEGTVESFFEGNFYRVHAFAKKDPWAFSSRRGWTKPTIILASPKAKQKRSK